MALNLWWKICEAYGLAQNKSALCASDELSFGQLVMEMNIMVLQYLVVNGVFSRVHTKCIENITILNTVMHYLS
jgi:hypothetical protein